MNKIPPRLVVYSQDVQNITGRTQRTANRILDRIRKKYNKQTGDCVTVYEFCTYMKLDEIFVRQYLVK